MHKNIKSLLGLLGIDINSPQVTVNTTPEQEKQGVLAVTITIGSLSPDQQAKMNNFAAEIGLSYTNESRTSLYIGLSDYLKACINEKDNDAGKKLRTVANTYGMLLHEAAIFMYINDAAYDWEFLNQLLVDLPETYTPLPTLDRFKESMKWIDRTVNAIDQNFQTKQTSINRNYGRYIKNLKMVFELICAEQARSYDFELGFDFKAAEHLKTMSISRLKVLPCQDKPRNSQWFPDKVISVIEHI